MRARSVLAGLLHAATVVSILVSLWMIFIVAPEERVMGAAQKIFYFHVPIAIVTFASVFVLLAGAIGYLWTRRRVWDHLSIAATELGLLFCTLVLITGPIWAKPAWGVWWTWEAKLTTTLVLWILLAACLMVRGYAENRDQAARLGAVLGIIAAVDVPIIHKAVDWWRGQHPVVFGPGKTESLEPRMMTAFQVSMLAFFLLYGSMLLLRMRLAKQEERLEALVEGRIG
jgi:heme exporter protein C